MKQENDYRIKNVKLRMHLIYISVILIGITIMTIILAMKDNDMFRNAISVSSTVVSIILSVIAIILSVTGERANSEIRNKVDESVEELERCAEKTSDLKESFDETIENLKILSENIDQKVIKEIPEMAGLLNELTGKSGTQKEETKFDPVKNILSFLDNGMPGIKKYVLIAYESIENTGKTKKAIGIDEIIQMLINSGAKAADAIMAQGLVIGSLMTGALSEKNDLERIINGGKESGKKQSN